MHVKERSESRLVLTGIPGRQIWMLVLCGLGAVLTAGCVYFMMLLYREFQGFAFAHLPLGVGLLIAQALFWTGAITLAVGRLTLILDTAEGTGAYHVKSPIVDAGKSCTFSLKNVAGVAIETTVESRPGREGMADTVATVHRARLRLNRPRRAITLDETENDRVERIERIAQEVAAFLGKTVERPNDDAGDAPSPT